MPETPPSETDVVIIGAGLAGLSAAATLQKAGIACHILEASDGVGGRVRSDHVDGWILDRGFQILLTAYPEVRRQIDLDALNLGTFSPGAQVWLGDQLHQVGDPFRDPKSLWATATSPIGSLRDKLTLLRLRQRVLRGDARSLLRAPERTTADHLQALGFSTAMAEQFLGPLFAGIQLDKDLQTSSRMFDIIFRSLSEGDAAVPANGMGAIPQQLAARLGPECLSLTTPAHTVNASDTTVTIGTDAGTITAAHAIIATEGPAAAKLLDIPVPGSRHVGCVWFGAPKSPAPNRRILLDGKRSGPAQNIAVLSDVAPSYAPPGQSLIAAACVADTGADLDERVRKQMRGWFGSQVDGWTTLRVDRIAHGQPDQSPPLRPKQSVRHGDRLWVCGDHRDTGSLQGAMYSGRRTGEAVAKLLGAKTPA